MDPHHASLPKDVHARSHSPRSSRAKTANVRESAVVDWLVRLCLRLGARISVLAPALVLDLFALAIGFVAMCLGWRRVTLANVRHVRAKDPPNPLTSWILGTQQIASHIKAIFGILHASVSNPEMAGELLVDGREHLEPYLGQRGVIIVAPHAGPYPTIGMMASRWLGNRSPRFQGELAIVVRLCAPFRSQALMKWFAGCFLDAGVTIIPADAPPRHLARQLFSVLSKNGIVVLLIDEPTPTPSQLVPFFDSAIQLPAGPVRLALATGSVIIPSMATYERGRKVTLRISKPIEPSRDISQTLNTVGQSLEQLIASQLGQWSMLTPIWTDSSDGPPPAGQSYADLHLHTTGSDGLCVVADWSRQAPASSLALIAVTDHDHIETVRRWNEAHRGAADNVLPGVEITARGRIVHIGVLFPREIPAELPKPGTPLLAVMRWARAIEGSLVVLVHPLPGLWRLQLRRLARAGLLPDAIETHFPLAFWRTASFEHAAAKYGIAAVGSSDAHLALDQLGRHVTQFPGHSVDDLVAAIRSRETRAVTRPAKAHPPVSVYLLQSIYSWLLPFRNLPRVATLRQRMLMTARARAVGAPPVRDSIAVTADDQRTG